DIKQLDYAKRHLQTSITALKRLHMLVTAVDQLEYMASQRLYKEAASLMEAVNSLFTHFESYTKVGKIIELQKSVNAIRADLETQIFGDFQIIGALASVDSIAKDEVEMNQMFKNLSMACAVVTALGHETRAKLVMTFCTGQLLPYEKVFGGKNSQAGALSNIDARFSWFFQLISAIEGRMEAIFPIHWQMSRRLCLFFCERTRAHLLTQLGAVGSDELDVTSLLKALQKALLFEREVVQRYEGEVDESKPELNEKGQLIDPGSAEGIKRRLLRQKRLGEYKAIEEELKRKSQNEDYMGVNHETEDVIPTISGMLSRTFDPFMTSYVALERKNMENMIFEVMSAELVDRNGALPVFSSSVNMFAYIRNSVKRCTALTVGQTFFDLHVEFKYCLTLYSQRLIAKLPAFASSELLSPASTPSHQSSRWRLSDKQEEELCFVINTAEYCAETLPSLEEVIRNRIDPAYAEAIELSKETDTYHDVAAAAMKCIVLGLDNLLEEEWNNMQKINWASFENVGDESAYVMSIADKIRPYVPTLHSMLSGLYFTNFCDKFAAAVVPKVLQSIMKCKRVNPVATQQLLLDVHALKMLFLNLPAMGREGETQAASVPARYSKFVTTEMTHAEAVLKLIGTPTEMIIESFKIMWPEGTAADFQAILNMKGLKKADQLQLLEQLGLERKSQPKQMMAGVEEKMTDMTEIHQPNKSFIFLSLEHGLSTNSSEYDAVLSTNSLYKYVYRQDKRSKEEDMRNLFRKERSPSPVRTNRTSDVSLSPSTTGICSPEVDALKKRALHELEVDATLVSAAQSLLTFLQSQERFPFSRSETTELVKKCCSRITTALRVTLDGIEKNKMRSLIFTSTTPQQPYWNTPTLFESVNVMMKLLSKLLKDQAQLGSILDDKLHWRLIHCIELALNVQDTSGRQFEAIENMTSLLSALIVYPTIVLELAEKDCLLRLYEWCALEKVGVYHYKVVLAIPRSFIGPQSAHIITHLRNQECLLVLLEQMKVDKTCDVSGIIRIIAAHLRYASAQGHALLHTQLQARRRYDILFEFLILWLKAQDKNATTEASFELVHSLQELLLSGSDKPADYYPSKAKELLTILKPTPRPRMCFMCNPPAMDVVMKLIYRLQLPLNGSSTTPYQEMIQCQVVHTLGHVFMQDASHYVIAMESNMLESLVQRLEEFSDVVKLAIGSIFSSVAMEAGVVPLKELRRIQSMLDMQIFSYSSVHMILVLLVNLLRFNKAYIGIMIDIGMSDSLYHIFVEDAQAEFRFVNPTGARWNDDNDVEALLNWIQTHTVLLATEDEVDSEHDSGLSSTVDHNIPLIFELVQVFTDRCPSYWTNELLTAMSGWVFDPIHSTPCLHVWAILLRTLVISQPNADITINTITWGLQVLRKVLVSPEKDWPLVEMVMQNLIALLQPSSDVSDKNVKPLENEAQLQSLAQIAITCDVDIVLVAIVMKALDLEADVEILKTLKTLLILLQSISTLSVEFRSQFNRYDNLTDSKYNALLLIESGAIEAILLSYFPIKTSSHRPLHSLLVALARIRLNYRDLRCWVQLILSNTCSKLLPLLLQTYSVQDILASTQNIPRFEFELAIHGYAQYQFDLPPTVAWPPQEGYVFSTWIYIDDFSESHRDVEAEYTILMKRDQCIMCRSTYTTPVPLKCSHIACRSCVQKLAEFGGACAVCNPPTFYLWSLRSSDGRSIIDFTLKGAKLFIKTNASKQATPFQHTPLVEKRWYHVAIVHSHQRFQFQSGSTITLYIQGAMAETIKMSYPPPSSSSFIGMFGSSEKVSRQSKAKWCLGPTYAFDEPLTSSSISSLYAAGPLYDQLFFGMDGSGNIPVALDSGIASSSSTFLDVVASTVSQTLSNRSATPITLPTQPSSINAERILIAYSPRNLVSPTIITNNCRMGVPQAQGSGGVFAIDPKLLPQAAFQLCGSGAKLAYLLLEHAQTIEGVECSLQLLLCLTRGQRNHLIGIEREGGYEIVNLLLRKKSQAGLLSLSALSSIFEIVQGDLFNVVALQNWILDTSIWFSTSHEIQRTLCATLYQILVIGSSVDKKKLQDIGIVRQLLYILLHRNLRTEFAGVVTDLLLVCLDSLAVDSNYVDVSLFLASLMSSNFRFIQCATKDESLQERIDRLGLSPRGVARKTEALTDKFSDRQAYLRELLLSIVIKAVQKQDVKISKLAANDVVSSPAVSPQLIVRPKLSGARKILSPMWLGLFLYPSRLPTVPLVSMETCSSTILLAIQLLDVLLVNRHYEQAYKSKGYYKLLAYALPAQGDPDTTRFPFAAMYFRLLCIILGPPVDGWPYKDTEIELSVAHLSHDFAPNIQQNVVKNAHFVRVLLTTIRRAYMNPSFSFTQPDILHLEVLRFMRYVYETMPAFRSIIDTTMHQELMLLIFSVVRRLSDKSEPFAHPVAMTCLDLLVESLTSLCLTTLPGLNIVKSVVAGPSSSNPGLNFSPPLSDGIYVQFQSFVLIQILKRTKEKLSIQEFWLPGSVYVIDNIGGLCLLSLQRIQCLHHSQPGIPVICGPQFCPAGPTLVMDLIFYLLFETPVGINASKSTFQPPSQDKKKRQFRQFLGTIGVNLARTSFETDPFMEAMYASLNGLILHQFAVLDKSDPRLLAVLQRLHRQREVILGSRNGDKNFFQCMCWHLLQWILPENPPDLQEAAIAIWIDLLYFQKVWVSELLTVTLKVSNAGYSVNLVKNGFDQLLSSQNEVFLRWLAVVGPPLKQLEADLDSSYVLWIEKTRKDVNKEWTNFYTEKETKRKQVDEMALIVSKLNDHAKELYDICRREVQRQARWQSDQKDRDLFGLRQFEKIKSTMGIVYDRASNHPNIFIQAQFVTKKPPTLEWSLDATEGTYRMRKRLFLSKVQTPVPKNLLHRHRSYSCSDLSRVDDTEILLSSVKPPSPKHNRMQSSATLDEDVYDDDGDDVDWQKWVLLDDSALDAKLRPLLVPGDDVSEDLHDCFRVDGMAKCPSVLILGTTHLYLVDNFKIDMKSKVLATDPHANHDCRFWLYEDVLEIHKRRYQLQHVAIELFAHDGRNYLITLKSGQERERVFSLLCSKCPNVKGAASGLDRNATNSELLTKILRNSLMERWIHGEVTNFEYLMHLNTLAGRSYNDLTQYPVFPWVLSDYTSDTIDLSDPGVYRDLAKPMGALYREEEFRARYESLEDTDVPAFHYGTHYSSSAIVLHYLIRLQPFTSGSQQLQGGRFDHADRLFSSIQSSYASASGCSQSHHQSNNTQDVKELIPEFFYLPQFLENPNHINFGKNQDGVAVDKVILPPWAHNSASEFVRINRAALESPYVSSMLHHWIDLVFGYKQQGAAAVEACNVFYHLTYEGALDLETVMDVAIQKAYLDQINEFGQTPSQLFKAPHPARDKDKVLFLQRMQRTFLNLSVLNNSTPSTPNPTETPNDATSLSTSTSMANLQSLVNDGATDLHGELKREVHLNPVIEQFRTDSSNTVHQIYLKSIVGLRREERVFVVPTKCLFLPPSVDTMLSSDLKFLSWGCRDRALRMFSINMEGDTRLLSTLELLDFCSSYACITSDGRTIITVDAKSPILHVWSMKLKTNLARSSASMTLRATLATSSHGTTITCVQVSRAYSILVTGCSSGVVLLWDLNRLSVLRPVLTVSTPIVAIAMNEISGDFAIATGPTWYISDVNGNILASSPLAASPITSVCLSNHDATEWAREKLVVTGHADGSIGVWTYGADTPHLKATKTLTEQSVSCLHLSKNSKRLYSGHTNGLVYVWCLRHENNSD
ncbi:vacuolar protein sorting-associated protein 53, partial [Thraustotheca clavata]